MSDTDTRLDPYETAPEPQHATACRAVGASVIQCCNCGAMVPDADRDRMEACLVELREWFSGLHWLAVDDQNFAMATTYRDRLTAIDAALASSPLPEPEGE